MSLVLGIVTNVVSDLSVLTVSSLQLQAYLRDIVGSVSDHCNKASIAIKLVNLFAGSGPCLQFIKSATSVKRNKTRYACICFSCHQINGLSLLDLFLDSLSCGLWHRVEEP